MNNQNQNTGMPAFTTVGGSNGTPWKPQAHQNNGFYYNPMDPNNVRMGFYKAVEHIPTPQFGPNSIMTLIVLHLCDGQGNLGETINVAANGPLVKRMDNFQLNSFVQIKYDGPKLKKGLAPGTPFSGNNYYHLWTVGVWADCPFNYKDLLAKQPLSTAAPIANPQVQTAQPQSYQQPVHTQQPVQGQQQQNPYLNGQNQQPAQFQQGQQFQQNQQPPVQNYNQAPPQNFQNNQPVQTQGQNFQPQVNTATPAGMPAAPSFMQNNQQQQTPQVQNQQGLNVQGMANPFANQNPQQGQYNQDIQY